MVRLLGVAFEAMKIPEPLFKIINIVVGMLLKSPFHALMSRSVLLITYTGRKSGRAYSTPVRYIRRGVSIRCFTSDHGQWWRNVKANPQVTLLVAGSSGAYQARVLARDPGRTSELLTDYLAAFPQDAAYHEIRVNPDGSLDDNDLLVASQKAVVVEFEEV